MSIAVGQAAPDFTLLNQEKKEVKLSDFVGKKNVVLCGTRWIGAPHAPMSMPASSMK